MLVTEIRPQKRDETRYNIFIDGEYAFALPMQDILYFKLKEGCETTEETVEYIEDCIRNAAVKSMALSQLKKETWNTYVSDLKCILGLAGIWKKDSKEGDINMDEIIRGGEFP